jgi:hypothetical protein
MIEKEKEIYENIEKILMKKIDNKNRKEKISNERNNFKLNNNNNNDIINIEDYSNEIISLKKCYKEDNQIKSHFDKIIDSEKIEKINCFKSLKAGVFKHSLKLYNQKVREYSYNLFDNEINNKKNKSEVIKKYKISKK